MASSQYERKEELNNEEKVTLDELIKQAESEKVEEQSLAVVAQIEVLSLDACQGPNVMVAGPNPIVGVNLLTQLTIIVGALKNQTKGSLCVSKTHKWAGYIVKKYIDPLKSSGAFTVSAVQKKGVKAAVVYSGKNQAGVECAWLLAFANTKALGTIIYGECGLKRNFNNIDWAQVESKLNDAGPITHPNDKETGTGIYATIVGTSGKFVVAAAFTG